MSDEVLVSRAFGGRGEHVHGVCFRSGPAIALITTKATPTSGVGGGNAKTKDWWLVEEQDAPDGDRKFRNKDDGCRLDRGVVSTSPKMRWSLGREKRAR